MTADKIPYWVTAASFVGVAYLDAPEWATATFLVLFVTAAVTRLERTIVPAGNTEP